MLAVRKVAFILPMVLVPAMAWAQTQTAGQTNPSEHADQNSTAQGNSTSASPSDNGAAASSDQNTDEDQKKDQSEPKQTKRMMYVVPNFAAVSANTELPPLSARGKFVLAWHDSFDYSSFVWTGIVAAQSYGLDSDPELGSGIAGYGRYYWRAFVDGTSGTYFTEAIVPAMTHEDPRYYTMGHGGFFHRMGYALSRSVLTKTDSGGTSFNWSEVGGNGLEAALSNAYYPPQERGISQTATNWATQMESAALNNIAKEFWPDFRSKVLRRK